MAFALQALGVQAAVTQSPLDQLNNSLKELADKVSQAVVVIKVWGYGMDNEDDDNQENARNVVKQLVAGAGVILDSDGYIITNAHVINGAKHVQVTVLPPRTSGMPVRTYMEVQGRTFDATIVGVHQETDLAVLKIKASGLPTLPLFNYEDLRQGQMVIAFGNPLGIRNAATIGIVSAVARQVDSESSVVYIQTDAALNPGNSGGALVDTAGRLVGINAAMLNGERVGLAVPSDTVKFVYDQIRKSGRVHQGEIGLGVQTVTPIMAAGLKLSRESGVIVSDVRPGLPAEKAGIQCEDLILATDGQAVESALQFVTLMYRRRPGDRLSLRLLRGKDTITVDLSVVEREMDTDPLNQVVDVDKNQISTLDVVAVNIDNDVAATIPGIRERSGVLVTGKYSKREGTETSLKIGDVIHAVNGAPVGSVADIRAALNKLASGSPVVMRVERQKRFLYLVSEVE